jgi:IclR family transcriptional regulator, pca regulon regulatory protein
MPTTQELSIPAPAAAEAAIDPRDDPSFVESFARGLSVIRAFGPGREQMSLAEIAKLTHLPRATVRRALFTLVSLGYAADDGRHFRLTPRILSLGHAYLSSTPLPGLLQPALETVSEMTRESCSASILDGTEIIYVARSATKRIMSVGLNVGSRLPAYCTSMGRVLLAAEPLERQKTLLNQSRLTALTDKTLTDPATLLAEFSKVQKQGYAYVDQELEIGLRSIAVPVHNAKGQVVAAINISTQANRMDETSIHATIREALLKAAQSITPSLMS